MYPHTDGEGSRWETRAPAIARNYVRTWLVVDLISVFPFYAISNDSGDCPAWWMCSAG